MFLTIGLQCLDKLRSDPDLRLCSAEQIQFRKSSTEIEVVIDPAYTKYSDAHETVTRECLMEQVLSQLARHVTAVDEKENPAEAETLLKHYNMVVAGDLGEKRRTTLDAVEAELRAAYEKLSPEPGKYWRGVCRPRLGQNKDHWVSVVPELRERLCEECLPRQLSDLRWPKRIRSFVGEGAPLTSILPGDGMPQGRTWCQVTEDAETRVSVDAETKGVTTIKIPTPMTCEPLKEEAFESVGQTRVERTRRAPRVERTRRAPRVERTRRAPNVEMELQKRLRSGCIIQLRDLLKTYRLTYAQCDDLVYQLRRRLLSVEEQYPRGQNYCVGSYGQVYLSLDKGNPGTELHIVLNPWCMQANSEEQATEITEEFIDQFRADAGCDIIQPTGPKIRIC
ncbi:hypothetical protein GNI_173480 [Gregarina niphandrodes]|uniref:Uncharacterized protein n=1 Tax=Gregarina niphandrodes TaxID=110365 RepID=A0A023AXM8_GRENI|nr:hypothetical protein GNI_173480 [Gregarina niphandrodes]EZG43402.1 hypothetical protein GNI_173480 [Gregarina niphandrodes]|eukprot:XP_011133368.1 hypothetical protein GNI_173480 [Gregarina niphandrodes]